MPQPLNVTVCEQNTPLTMWKCASAADSVAEPRAVHNIHTKAVHSESWEMHAAKI
jgi:hypothetical protein